MGRTSCGCGWRPAITAAMSACLRIFLKSQAETYRKVRNTLRYLLNNLTDFDPAKDAVPYDKLPEIDRWALHRLQEEMRDALAAYDEYKFYRVTSRLVEFLHLGPFRLLS